MSYTWVWAALLVAPLDWVAEAKGWKLLEYIAKPAVILILLFWLISAGGVSGYLIFFALGLLFSLAGDIFLMLPRERFLCGLLSFLVVHLAYTLGFTSAPSPFNLAVIVIIVLVGLVALRLCQNIIAGVVSSGWQKLKIPVVIYTIVISLMLISALLTLTRSEWSAASALMVASGAMLFFLSDTFLAWNKFVQPLQNGRLIVIITYHIGQILIITGAVLHYTS